MQLCNSPAILKENRTETSNDNYLINLKLNWTKGAVKREMDVFNRKQMVVAARQAVKADWGQRKPGYFTNLWFSASSCVAPGCVPLPTSALQWCSGCGRQRWSWPAGWAKAWRVGWSWACGWWCSGPCCRPPHLTPACPVEARRRGLPHEVARTITKHAVYSAYLQKASKLNHTPSEAFSFWFHQAHLINIDSKEPLGLAAIFAHHHTGYEVTVIWKSQWCASAYGYTLQNQWNILCGYNTSCVTCSETTREKGDCKNITVSKHPEINPFLMSVWDNDGRKSKATLKLII